MIRAVELVVATSALRGRQDRVFPPGLPLAEQSCQHFMRSKVTNLKQSRSGRNDLQVFKSQAERGRTKAAVAV